MRLCERDCATSPWSQTLKFTSFRESGSEAMVMKIGQNKDQNNEKQAEKNTTCSMTKSREQRDELDDGRRKKHKQN